MNRAIWKFQLSARRTQSISMPVGATILYAREQGENICIWAEVDITELQAEERFIEVFPTGAYFGPSARRYLGSAHLANGSLIFHVYERL